MTSVVILAPQSCCAAHSFLAASPRALSLSRVRYSSFRTHLFSATTLLKLSVLFLNSPISLSFAKLSTCLSI